LRTTPGDRAKCGPNAGDRSDGRLFYERRRRAEFLVDAFGRGDDRIAVGEVGLDRACVVAEFVGEGVDPVSRRASSATGWPSARGARAVASPMREEAPVMTARRRVF
jgi:hypothetical protein